MYTYILTIAVITIIVTILSKKTKGELKLPNWLIYVSLGLTVISRLYWYFFSKVPLGYDPGWYKWVFDHPFAEEWTKSVFPWLFSFVGYVLSFIFGSAFLVKWGAVALSVGICFALYYYLSKIINRDVGLIASLLYAVSYTMYKVFWWNYIKNMIGMILLLVAYYYMMEYKKNDSQKNRLIFILVAGIIGGMHRPAALIIGVSYLCYYLYLCYTSKKFLYNEFITGLGIIVLMLLFNFDRLLEFAIGPALGYGVTVLTGDAGSGTFFNFTNYWYYAVSYMPFALVGILKLKDKNFLKYGAVLCLVTVVFKIYFYNRFIIYLDFFMLIFAAYGLFVLLLNHKWMGYVVLAYVIIFSGHHFVTSIGDDAPLINDAEFNFIKEMDCSLPVVTPPGLATWVKGYSDCEVYSPGMFDNNPYNKEGWDAFWNEEIDFVVSEYVVYEGGAEFR